MFINLGGENITWTDMDITIDPEEIQSTITGISSNCIHKYYLTIYTYTNYKFTLYYKDIDDRDADYNTIYESKNWDKYKEE